MLGTMTSMVGGWLGLTPALVAPRYVLELEPLSTIDTCERHSRYLNYRPDLIRVFIRDPEVFGKTDNIWNGMSVRIQSGDARETGVVRAIRILEEIAAGKHPELAAVLEKYKRGQLDDSGICIFLRASDV
jgi:hypothetical protein